MLPAAVQEDGWVVCRVFKKKCFFKIGGGEGSTSSQGADAGGHHLAVSPPLGGHHDQARASALLASHYMHPHQYYHHHASSYYSQMQAPAPPHAAYSHHVQVQDLLTNHRPEDDAGAGAGAGYDFSGLPVEHHPGGLDVGSSDGVAPDGGQLGEGRDDQASGAAEQWQAMDGFSNGGGAAVQQMASAMSSGAQRGGEMDLWGYGR